MKLQLTKGQTEFLQTHWPLRGDLKFHRRVANFVYFARLDGREVVLRLTEPIHRKIKEIESELDWMNYLAMNGMRIAKPVATITGSFMVELPGEKTYYAAVFEKAPGSFLDDDVVPTEEFIATWGGYLGRMHRLTKDYQPSLQIQRRQQWEQDESLAMALRSLDKTDELPYRRLNELMEWMRSLPQENHCYGLVHCDLHRGNFFVENGDITAFDFDDACYQWFSYDIVAPINSINKNLFEGTNTLSKEKALESFLKGYSRENSLEQIWIERIHVFDKYRAALIYHWAKTCVKEKVFDSNGLEWAKEKLPKLLDAIRDPLKLF